MGWFNEKYAFNQARLRIAHVTDTHLFANIHGEYFGVNTAQHFRGVLEALSQQQVDAVIFGGDLTQDHTFESYELFAQLLADSNLECPLFWLPGNHDEIDYLSKISQGQIQHAKCLAFELGQILLVNSKGPTPAGWVESTHLCEIEAVAKVPSLVFCHHNPLSIDGYLDKHMLENGPQLLNRLIQTEHVLNVFHGHVHNEYEFMFRGIKIYATPATSIQFSKHTEQWQQENLGAAYRLIDWSQQGIHTEVKWLER
ncbi:3',5'-cyclic-nucleotide phosphodiesterase [Pseudoalteromonas luteoviolacea]|uniref:3',5'-cyclic-nucleotide phosphodiesterase n=1 Tax=Pseudoalteromonas luteoviolacea TaxID=43657 RepID=A0A1C0TP22_9GAMM|nr:metallophosphoesterase [Pseudoalteromonas luteoviolacea]MBQ4813512.1 metallophosphoesterase [Pseudoalteromonas luteoviolacea]OCQ20623.1 3',5'-cyclic-nucleotide phosphodiesterase [Pseudoalteromonas luteoviolacea]